MGLHVKAEYETIRCSPVEAIPNGIRYVEGRIGLVPEEAL